MESKEVFDAINANHSTVMDQQAAAEAKQAEEAAKAEREAREREQKLQQRMVEKREAKRKAERRRIRLFMGMMHAGLAVMAAIVAAYCWAGEISVPVALVVMLIPVIYWAFFTGCGLCALHHIGEV